MITQRRANFKGEISLLWGLRIPLVISCAFLALNFTGALGPTTERAERAQADVTGYGFVLNARTGTPLQSARVTVGSSSFTSGRTGQYDIGRLSLGEHIAIATLNNYVPSGTVFSAFADANGTASVHIPPIYMVPKQPTSQVPPAGGTISHNDYQLRFALGGFAAGLTGFGAHPGTPAPPDQMPTVGGPKPPRSPVLPTTGFGDAPRKPIPLGVAYAEFPQAQGRSAMLRVPMVLPSEAVGVALPLLRLNETTGLWERAGDLNVIQLNPHIAEGPITRGGLYMLVSIATLNRANVFPEDDSTDVDAIMETAGVTFTLPVSFEIDEASPAGMRSIAFWVYGLREGDGNLTGVTVNFAAASAPGLVAEPTEHCPPTFIQLCFQNEGTPLIVEGTTVDGCGSTVNVPGACLCCPKGTKGSVSVKAGKASDEYELGVGVSEAAGVISGDLKAKANKRKEDIAIEYVCK